MMLVVVWRARLFERLKCWSGRVSYWLNLIRFMCFCWYVSFYVIAMLVLPVYAKLVNLTRNFGTGFLVSVFAYMLLRFVGKLFHFVDLLGSIYIDFMGYFPIIITGFAC